MEKVKYDVSILSLPSFHIRKRDDKKSAKYACMINQEISHNEYQATKKLSFVVCLALPNVQQFIDAGADIILVPAVGSVPGFRDEDLCEIVKAAHQAGALVLSAIGTSQEGASKEVIEQIAIQNKVAGVDIQHIGDAGYGGIAPIENIFAMSVAI